MGKLIDKKLKQEKGFSVAKSSLLPFEKPEQFIYIPNNIINIVSRYMVVVIGTATVNREVDVKMIINNAKNMFRDGARYNDNLWMQHCAASIREILVFIDPGHFSQAYQTIELTNPDVDIILRFLTRACTYLSSVVHLRESSKVGDAENLYPGQGYGQKNYGEFSKSEPDFFEKVCIDIIYTLYDLFTRYVGNTQKNNESD